MPKINILDINVIRHYIKQVFYTIKKYQQYRKFNNIVISFFNFNAKCPGEIRDCECLRNEFLMEVEQYKKYKVCSTCDIQYIKLKFINKLKQILNYE